MKTLLVDGDIFCYSALSVREIYRFEKINKLPDDYKGKVNINGNGDVVVPVFTDSENDEYLRKSIDNLVNEISKVKDGLFCSDMRIAVKGDNNFRSKIFPTYKANRKPATSIDALRKTVFVPKLRQVLIDQLGAIASTGMEADDLLRMWHTKDSIIASADKDLLCIPGKHFLPDWNKKDLAIIETRKLGGVRKEHISGTLVDISDDFATRFYHEQILMGDPVDNIPGVPGVGPVGAKKLIIACRDEKEMQECVVDAYMRAYGFEDWYKHFDLNLKLIHLRRFEDDTDPASEWPIIQEIFG